MCVLCRSLGSELGSLWHTGSSTDDLSGGFLVRDFGNSVGQSAVGNQYVDGLLSGFRWSGTVTYSFPDSASDYASGYGSGEPTAPGFTQISLAQQHVVDTTMAQIMGFTNLTIQFAGTDNADIRIATSSEANPTAYAYYPQSSTNGEGGDVWIGTSYDYTNPVLGNYSYLTLIHELGHSFGLKHSQESGGVAGAVPADHDALEYSVMSYRSYVGGPTTGYTNEAFGYPQSYMMNDILALQTMYGADFTLNSTDTVYKWSPTTGQLSLNGVAQTAPGANRVFLTIWDGGGNDTYDFSAYTTGVTLDLNPASYSITSDAQRAYLGNNNYAHGNVYNAYLYNNDARSYIENAIGGTGNDTLIGNAIGNRLEGGRGNDTLTGGAGNDVYVYGANCGNDVITDFVAGASGVDEVYLTGISGVSSYAQVMACATQVGADTLFTFGTGATLKLLQVSMGSLVAGDFIFDAPPAPNEAPTAIALSNSSLTENSPGAKVGNVSVTDPNGDTVFGFAVSDARFEVVQTAGIYSLGLKSGVSLDFETEPTITLTVTATDPGGLSKTQQFTLSVLDGPGATINGTSGNDQITATSTVAGQQLPTNDDDVIKGLGGNDTINGLAGNDLIDGGAGADVLDGGAGIDTVTYAAAAAAVTVSLATGSGSGSDAAGDTLANFENLTGSNFNDTLEGNSGNNVLSGGTGTDTLSYEHAAAAVTVNLAVTSAQATGGAGSDTISGFENLTGSAYNDSLSGTSGANTLTGGAGDDILDGGAGADTLVGGTGSDTASYASAGAGIMARLFSTGSNTGDASGDTFNSIENLTGSNFNDTLVGDTNANRLSGGNGNDVLKGREGNDYIDGGAGTDASNYSGNFAQYSISKNADGSYTIVDNGSGYSEGTDTLVNIETVNFNDKAVTLSTISPPTPPTGSAPVVSGLTSPSGNEGGTITLTGSVSDADGTVAGRTVTINWGNGTSTATIQANGSFSATRVYGDQGSYAISVSATDADGLIGNAGTTANIANVAPVLTGLQAPSGAAGQAVTISGKVTDVGLADVPAGSAVSINWGDGSSSTATTLADGSFGGSHTYANQGTYSILTTAADKDGASGSASVSATISAAPATPTGVTLTGTSAADTLTGGTGDDMLDGKGGNDVLNGAGGNDILDGGAGGDQLVGGAGTDTASYASAAAGVFARLFSAGSNTGDAAGDSYSGIENLTGSNFNDTLVGDTNANRLSGGNGDDILKGREGNDYIDGGAGTDSANYSGNFAQYSISKNLDGSYTIIDNGSGYSEGTDTLVNIETVNFNDKSVALSTIAGSPAAGNPVGGSGAGTDHDSFVFVPIYGEEIVTNFGSGDIHDLLEHDGSAFNTLISNEIGAHPVIDFGHGTVTLSNVGHGSIGDHQFLF
jgi:serralysin